MIFSVLEAKNYHILGSMKINHSSKNNKLSDTLVTFLNKNINLAHIKLISLFVVAPRKAKSIFRYGLDIVTEFLMRGRNEYKIPIFNLSTIVNQTLTPD